MALGFESVNGFHDTTTAVTTIICIHSLRPTITVQCYAHSEAQRVDSLDREAV